MKIKYLGHACTEVYTHNQKIIIDPFISGNPLAKEIRVENLKPDYIFITHAHGDHIMDVETIASQSEAKIVANFEIAQYFESKGFPVIPLNIGASKEFSFGKVHAVNAIHSSSFPDGTYGGTAQGFVFEIEDKRIYHSGDTALTMDMQLIHKHLGKLDISLLPIGNVFTMGYEQACIAAEYLSCDRVMGIHYNTFPPIEIDESSAIEYFKKHHKELILLPIGEFIEI